VVSTPKATGHIDRASVRPSLFLRLGGRGAPFEFRELCAALELLSSALQYVRRFCVRHRGSAFVGTGTMARSAVLLVCMLAGATGLSCSNQKSMALRAKPVASVTGAAFLAASLVCGQAPSAHGVMISEVAPVQEGLPPPTVFLNKEELFDVDVKKEEARLEAEKK